MKLRIPNVPAELRREITLKLGAKDTGERNLGQVRQYDRSSATNDDRVAELHSSIENDRDPIAWLKIAFAKPLSHRERGCLFGCTGLTRRRPRCDRAIRRRGQRLEFGPRGKAFL